ncbi:STP1 protein [Plasmodium ovale wallikeri]|uniref:STP1 protein n=1 Tax=Plasmodium ovale wallikeri TaxID=864142 RepID=A0A1A9ARU9_PLAOA|nr:STP1 protein [Plasmodium ovale wallikeri]
MVDNLGYTTDLRNIPVEVFFDMITNDIKKLIHIYGHKHCGLRHEELCEKIKNIIFEKKKVILPLMDESGKKKLISDWESQRNGFFDKLFEKEGFINMCFPPKSKGNQNLQKLKLKHIEFCKEKDVRRSFVEENNEFSECVKYNSWINKETASFTQEFLRNVRESTVQVVTRYFTTKKHPRGHDPRETYRNSKLDCNQYNPPTRSHPKGSVAKTSTISLHPPAPPIVRRKSQGETRSSVTDADSTNAKTKADVKTRFQTEPPPDSQIPASPKTQAVDTHIGQATHAKTKAPVSTVSINGEKQEATPIQGQSPTNSPPSARDEAPPQVGIPSPPPKDATPTPIIQNVPQPTTTASSSSTPATVKDATSSQTPDTSSSLTITSVSSLNSGSPSTSNILPPAAVTNDQDRASQSSTTSETHTTTHPTQSLPSTTPADLSLSPPQAPVLTEPPAVTTANEPGTPVSSNASTLTTTVTTRTTALDDVTSPTMSITQGPILSIQQSPSAPNSQDDPHTTVSSKPNETAPNKEPQQTVIHQSTSFSGRDNEGISVPTQQDSADGNKIITLPINTYQKFKDSAPVSSTSLPEGAQPSGKPSNTSTKFPPLTTIIPTIIIILAAITLLLQLYKYTPFGFLIGRRRKRKKRDLRRTFKIPEKSTYESPNITVHELEDPNLVGKGVENDVYTKLLKINRYKQEMKKRKKENKKTLIEVHMEVLEEYKSDEWELHKGDFLEICLRGFINDENDFYSNFPNSKLTINNIKNEKTIEDIQNHEILWNNWIEDHRNILEQWKKEEWFHILKNKWRNEEQKYKEKCDKLQENILNEQEKYSIVNQKNIWKQWISKQATLIDMFNKEDWFKSMIYAQNKEKNNYHINEYNDISVTSKIGLKNEKTNHEEGRSKDIIQKLMVQIHMMVLEESIKEDIIKHKELCIDNFIEDIHHQNNYDEKRNIPQCDTYDFSVPVYEEIHTSRNK